MHSVSLYSVHPTACAVALQCTTASVALVPVYVAGARAGGGSATTEVTTVSHQEGGLAQTPQQYAETFRYKSNKTGRILAPANISTKREISVAKSP